jgi:hypothetical protein
MAGDDNNENELKVQKATSAAAVKHLLDEKHYKGGISGQHLNDCFGSDLVNQAIKSYKIKPDKHSGGFSGAEARAIALYAITHMNTQQMNNSPLQAQFGGRDIWRQAFINKLAETFDPKKIHMDKKGFDVPFWTNHAKITDKALAKGLGKIATNSEFMQDLRLFNVQALAPNYQDYQNKEGKNKALAAADYEAELSYCRIPENCVVQKPDSDGDIRQYQTARLKKNIGFEAITMLPSNLESGPAEQTNLYRGTHSFVSFLRNLEKGGPAAETMQAGKKKIMQRTLQAAQDFKERTGYTGKITKASSGHSQGGSSAEIDYGFALEAYQDSTFREIYDAIDLRTCNSAGVSTSQGQNTAVNLTIARANGLKKSNILDFTADNDGIVNGIKPHTSVFVAQDDEHKPEATKTANVTHVRATYDFQTMNPLVSDANNHTMSPVLDESKASLRAAEGSSRTSVSRMEAYAKTGGGLHAARNLADKLSIPRSVINSAQSFFSKKKKDNSQAIDGNVLREDNDADDVTLTQSSFSEDSISLDSADSTTSDVTIDGAKAEDKKVRFGNDYTFKKEDKKKPPAIHDSSTPEGKDVAARASATKDYSKSTSKSSHRTDNDRHHKSSLTTKTTSHSRNKNNKPKAVLHSSAGKKTQSRPKMSYDQQLQAAIKHVADVKSGKVKEPEPRRPRKR